MSDGDSGSGDAWQSTSEQRLNSVFVDKADLTPKVDLRARDGVMEIVGRLNGTGPAPGHYWVRIVNELTVRLRELGDPDDPVDLILRVRFESLSSLLVNDSETTIKGGLVWLVGYAKRKGASLIIEWLEDYSPGANAIGAAMETNSDMRGKFRYIRLNNPPPASDAAASPPSGASAG